MELAAPVASGQVAGRRGACVLVVEDDPLVGELVRGMLESLGHVPTVARTADEALAAWQGETAFDVLLTDVMMPGVTGPQLARRLLALRPGVPVVYTSGYADETGIDADAPFLAKPYSVGQLAAALGSALGAPERLAA